MDVLLGALGVLCALGIAGVVSSVRVVKQYERGPLCQPLLRHLAW
jgi:hypothetical protein